MSNTLTRYTLTFLIVISLISSFVYDICMMRQMVINIFLQITVFTIVLQYMWDYILEDDESVPLRIMLTGAISVNALKYIYVIISIGENIYTFEPGMTMQMFMLVIVMIGLLFYINDKISYAMTKPVEIVGVTVSICAVILCVVIYHNQELIQQEALLFYMILCVVNIILGIILVNVSKKEEPQTVMEDNVYKHLIP